MSTITVITVWNREPLFRQFEAELTAQTGIVCRLLGVDNSQNRYSSARAALMAPLDQVETEYVAFAHQDIRFSDRKAMANLLEWVQKLENPGVIGVAGCPEGDQWVLLSNIVHGAQAVPAGKHLDEPMPIQSVDECLFLVKTEVLRKHPFTQRPGWHMYAVELCMELSRAGYTNYVVPAEIWHLSKGGSLDHTYLQTLEELVAEYGQDARFLNTTVKQWKTRGLDARLYRIYYYWKMKLKKFLVRYIPFLKD